MSNIRSSRFTSPASTKETRRLWWSLAVVVGLVAAGCGSDDDSSSLTTGAVAAPASTSAATESTEQTSASTDAPPSQTESTVAETDPTPVQMTDITFSFFPTTVQTFYPEVARAKGYFEKHGLNVEFVAIPSGPDLATALISGSSHISDEGLAIIGPLMSEQDQNIVALMGNINLNYGLVVRPDVPTPNIDAPFPQNIEDLRGLTIGVTARGSLTEDFVRRLLIAGGMDPDQDVTFVATGAAATLVPAFQQAQVDATVTFPPIGILLGEEGVDYKVVADVTKGNVGDLFEGYLVDVYAAMDGWLEDNGDVALGFCQAMKEAIDFSQEPANIDEVAELLGTYVNLEPAVARKVWEQYKGTFTHELTKSLWEAQGTFALGGSGGAPPFEEHVYAPCQEVFGS